MNEAEPLPLQTRPLTGSVAFWVWIDALAFSNDLPWQEALFTLIKMSTIPCRQQDVN